MKTISLTAYNRPEYTNTVLEALSKCDRLSDFDRIVLFIDPGDDRVTLVCDFWASQFPIPTEVHLNPSRLGVGGNPERAYTYVFEELGSDFHQALDDDAVLSPDALRIALWFADHHSVPGSRYSFLNLSDHNDYRGPGKNRGGAPEDPALLAESRDLSSPESWCFGSHLWPFLKRYWDKNTKTRTGWDWSIRLGMRYEGRISLTPVLSRSQNIGQFGGVHAVPDDWAAVHADLNHSDGAYKGQYQIVNPVPVEDKRKIDPWMVWEIPRLLKEEAREAAGAPSIKGQSSGHHLDPLRERKPPVSLRQRRAPNRELPRIDFNGTFSASRESVALKDCFFEALYGISTLPEDIRGIDGMSGQKYRSFINNLIRTYPDPRYLEIGSWRGSTATAALYGNSAHALCIDNWSQFGDPRSEFFANMDKVISDDIHFQFLEQDFRSVDFHSIGKFNIYLFDGPHSEWDQCDGITLAQPALLDRFVLIVDDWNWWTVRLGTFKGLLEAKCDVESSIEIRTTSDNTHPVVSGKASDWHNGYFLAVVRKRL